METGGGAWGGDSMRFVRSTAGRVTKVITTQGIVDQAIRVASIAKEPMIASQIAIEIARRSLRVGGRASGASAP